MKFVSLQDSKDCIQKAKELLYQLVDSKTVLFLSGGETPRPLYEILAKEEQITPAAACLIDERQGDKNHAKSNEKMIADTGLLKYFHLVDVPWHGILQNKTIEETTSLYDKKVRELLFNFPKSVAILGIGKDGHTAGIPAFIPNEKIDMPNFSSENMVVSYDYPGIYGQRITMTFTALSMIDNLIVLSFGKEKEEALKKIFTVGPLEEIPARFYNKSEITNKTILITDQSV